MGLLYIRIPTIWLYRLFPEKIFVTRLIFFLIFYLSPNIAPKLTGRSRSHSIPRGPLQISLAHFFGFDLPPKLRVVHIRKKIKIFIFSKMAPTIFIKFCGFIILWNPNNMALSAFPDKILVNRKYYFYFLFVS